MTDIRASLAVPSSHVTAAPRVAAMLPRPAFAGRRVVLPPTMVRSRAPLVFWRNLMCSCHYHQDLYSGISASFSRQPRRDAICWSCWHAGVIPRLHRALRFALTARRPPPCGLSAASASRPGRRAIAPWRAPSEVLPYLDLGHATAAQARPFSQRTHFSQQLAGSMVCTSHVACLSCIIHKLLSMRALKPRSRRGRRVRQAGRRRQRRRLPRQRAGVCRGGGRLHPVARDGALLCFFV